MNLTHRHKQLIIAALRGAQHETYIFSMEMRELNDYTQDEDEIWLQDEVDDLIKLITAAPTQE